MNKTLRTLFRSALALGVVAGLTVGAQAQTSVGTLGATSHTITTDTTWTTAGSPYTLNTIVYVTDGADLTIQPGVVIRGVSDAADGNNSNNNPGTLVITRGSKIFANGTSSLPIVFTDVTDDAVNGSAGTGSYAGVNNISGTTGGVILLGKTYTTSTDLQDGTNNGTTAPVATDGFQIEGLTLLSLGRYGGNAFNQPNSAGEPETLSNDNDDSGSMSYWSIRYGGEIIGSSNEINGFTLGAVGRQTDISHIEIVNALDDGIEFFGGTVNTKYITVFHAGDDSVDYDEGFRGKMQYYFVMQGGMTTSIGSGASDRIGEWDGANNGDNNVPFSAPTIYNATFVGKGGPNESASASGIASLVFSDGSGGRLFNSIIMNTQGAFVVEDTALARDSFAHASTLYSTATANAAWVDAQNANAPMYDHDAEGANILDMGQVALWNVGTPQITSGSGHGVATYGASLGWVGTKIIDLGATTGARPIAAITMAAMPNPVHGFETTSIDPRATNSATSTTRSAPEDGFFDQASFKGAFGPNYNWMEGWSLLDTIGVITSPANAAPASATPSFRFAVSFNTTSGASYLVQASSSPSSGFSTVGSVVGTGSSVTVIDERALSTRQFYQVVQQ